MYTQELTAIEMLSIPTIREGWTYVGQMKQILGFDVTVAGYNSFASRGYMNTREHIGWVRTASGGTLGIWRSETNANQNKVK